VLRRVIAGHASLYEGDDIVRMVHASDTIRNAVIIPATDLYVPIWELISPPDFLLHAEEVSVGRGAHLLQFGSFESAVRMRDWLATCDVAKFTGYRFVLGEDAVESGAIRDLRIRRLLINGVDSSRASSGAGAQR
jgi:hypothetical protein